MKVVTRLANAQTKLEGGVDEGVEQTPGYEINHPLYLYSLLISRKDGCLFVLHV